MPTRSPDVTIYTPYRLMTAQKAVNIVHSILGEKAQVTIVPLVVRDRAGYCVMGWENEHYPASS